MDILVWLLQGLPSYDCRRIRSHAAGGRLSDMKWRRFRMQWIVVANRSRGPAGMPVASGFRHQVRHACEREARDRVAA